MIFSTKALIAFIFFCSLVNAEEVLEASCKVVHNEKNSVLWNVFVHGDIAKRFYTHFQEDNFPVSTRQQKDEMVYTRMSSNLLCAHYENPKTQSHDYVCGFGFDGGGNARRPHKIEENGRKVFDGKCSLTAKKSGYVLMMSDVLAKFASDQTPIYFYKHNPDLDLPGKYIEMKTATHLYIYQVRKESAWGQIIDHKAAVHIRRKSLNLTDIGEN